MSDIEKLIERLRQHERFAGNIVVEAADALTRLVAPLPAEVEEAIRCCTEETRAITIAECARLLESQAREIARLAAENAELRMQYSLAVEMQDTVISELKSELETAKPLLKAAVRYTNEVTLASRIALAEAAQAFAKLDAKKGGA